MAPKVVPPKSTAVQPPAKPSRAAAVRRKPASTSKTPVAPKSTPKATKATRAPKARDQKRKKMIADAAKATADLRPVIAKLEAMRPADGRRIWEAVSSFGRNPTFADAEGLWNACIEYFRWVDENPLTEAKAFPTKEEVRVEMFPKQRAMTLSGLCLFLDISVETWRGWKTEGHALFRPDFVAVIRRVDAIVFEQKFSAAAAGLLNANIISQELGLIQKTEVTGAEGGPIQHTVKARVVMVPPKVPAKVETKPMKREGEE